MKKVKILNEDVIRKLIVETIDEVALGEGRKKKLEEEPVPNPETTELANDPARDAAHAEGQEDFGDDINQMIQSAVNFKNNPPAGTPPKMVEAMLESTLKMVNDIAKQKLGLAK